MRKICANANKNVPTETNTRVCLFDSCGNYDLGCLSGGKQWCVVFRGYFHPLVVVLSLFLPLKDTQFQLN